MNKNKREGEHRGVHYFESTSSIANWSDQRGNFRGKIKGRVPATSNGQSRNCKKAVEKATAGKTVRVNLVPSPFRLQKKEKKEKSTVKKGYQETT